jgi:hypothetical protein
VTSTVSAFSEIPVMESSKMYSTSFPVALCRMRARSPRMISTSWSSITPKAAFMLASRFPAELT